MNKKLLDKYQEISLSNYDVFNILDKKVRVLTYPELTKYKNIDDVLRPHGCFVLLYLTKESYGHWTCCIKYNDRIEVFDSYGDSQPDDELEQINMKFRKESNQYYPYLTKLLYESGYPVEYNDYKFQKHRDDIKTCGRHVAMRIKLKDIKLDDYYDIMTKLKKEFKLTYDELVTLLTMYEK
jgi:hypothetical protein